MSLDRVDETTLPRLGAHDGRAYPAPRRQSGAARVGRLFGRLIVLALLVAAGAWAYYANKSAPSMDMNMRVSSGGTPFPVVMGLAEQGRIAGSVIYTGSIAPYNEEDIYPRVTGRIVDMRVYPGDAVRAGQVVARLDSVELTSRTQEAQAMLATAVANRAQMQSDLVAAEQGVVQMEKELAMVDAERTYATSVAARTERLFQSGAVSRQEWENDRAMALSADAKWAAARAKLDQAHAMVAAARKKVEAADSMVAQNRAVARTAEIVRDYVNITTPTGGYVVKRLVAPGVLVQPGMAILKIAQLDRVRLQANVGEKDLPSIRVGSPVTVTLAGAGGAPISARVSSVSPFVDPGARTAVVEAIIDNRDRKLLAGQYVMMQFTTGERANAVNVPRGAVARLGPTSTVWVISGEQVEPRKVTTGLEGADRVEIVTGLQAGERIVVRGHEPLYAGARVADANVAAQPSGHAGHGATPAVPSTPAQPSSRAEHGTPSPPAPTPPAPSGTHADHGASVTPTPTPPAGKAPDASDPHKGMKMPGTNPPSAPKEPAHAGH